MAKEIVYTVRGIGTRDKATFSQKIPSATNQADTEDFVEDYAVLADAIILGFISKAQYTAQGTTLPTAASAFSDVEEVGVFECICADGTEAVITVPAINPTTVTDEGQLTGAGWDNIRAAILNGLSGTSPCGVTGSDIVAIKADYRLFKPSGKAQ